MPSAPEYYFVVRDQTYVSYLKKITLYHRKPLFLATIAEVLVTLSPTEGGKMKTKHPTGTAFSKSQGETRVLRLDIQQILGCD